jgi:SAM-dependent methyltransferase
MLKVAKKNVSGVRFVRSSMTDFRLGKEFDVVLCLFSSMGYLKTREEISRAIHNFVRHLKEGGILIVEPWIKKSDWSKGSIHMRNYESPSLKISRVGYSQARGNFSVMDERYLVAEKDKGIKYFEDHQEMRFFEPEWTFEAMNRAGLNPRFSEVEFIPGRTPIIAVKRRHASFRLSA